MIEKAREIRKALVALVGALTALLAANVLPENVAGYVATVVAILAVFGVYATPNTIGGLPVATDNGPAAYDPPQDASQDPEVNA